MILGIPLHKQKYRVEEDFDWELACIPLTLSKALFGKSHKMFTFKDVRNVGRTYILRIPKDTVFCLDKVHYTKTRHSQKLGIHFNLTHDSYDGLSRLKTVPKLEFKFNPHLEDEAQTLENLNTIKLEKL